MPDIEDIKQQLAQLRHEFAASLAQRIDKLIADLNAMHDQEDPFNTLQTIFRQTHTLSGSAGTFGFKQLSELSMQIELIIKDSISQHSLPDAKTVKNLNKWLKNLHYLAKVGPDVDLDIELPTDKLTDTATDSMTNRRVFIVEDDAELGQIICLQLEHYGFESRYFSTATEAKLSIENEQEKPAALVLDIVLPEGLVADTELTSCIQARPGAPIPCIFISSQDDWQSRLTAVRAGGFAYLCKPLDISSLVEQLNRITQKNEHEPYRVLVVDDSYELAHHYSLALRQAGMYAETLTDPADILQKLEHFKPEIILLDIYLCNISGLTVAQVIRQHHQHFSIPIVFLSTETEMDIQLKTLQQGDDFLEKPILDNQLISVVIAKIERARELNRLMYQDGLTGLLNHISLQQQLETEFARSLRQSSSLCYVMIDLDHFKQVNDRYGHEMGNQVLKSLASLLKDRLRKSDQIGRYGGEEFGVLLPDTNTEEASHIIDDIRTRFGQLNFHSDNQNFTCHFSAGIACAMDFEQAQVLIEGADKALYQAKENGRNQIQVYRNRHQ